MPAIFSLSTMNFLHTSDWHLGQSFYQYDRYEEHAFFLNELLQILEKEKTDVLLISGDVFDTAQPTASSTRQFYQFLQQATQRFPSLQIIAIAGNHDSPVRLEMPTPLLEDTSIHLVGYVKQVGNRQIDYQRLIIPLYENEEVVAYCLAVPFLRLGDTPKTEEGNNDYGQGVAAFYKALTAEAVTIANGKPLIAMGHLHAAGAATNEEDTAERPIIGGIESVQASYFPEALQYVALGHIHKAQAVADKQHIRYSGSPLPLSFAERCYPHQVVCFSLVAGNVQDIRSVALPLHTSLLSIPDHYGTPEEALNALSELADVQPSLPAPFLEVKIALDSPQPQLKNRIQEAVAQKHVRLARIDVRYKQANSSSDESQWLPELALQHLQPLEVLKRVYEQQFAAPLPTRYVQLFEEAQRACEIADKT